MLIVGHRGARGSELENSLASFRQALTLNLDAIEFDIHRTIDNHLVVMHDATTERTAGQPVRIADVTLSQLQQLRLHNGQTIPTLDEVLDVVHDFPVYIDIKAPGTAPLLIAVLRKHHSVHATVVSRLTGELQDIRKLQPDVPTYVYFLKAENPIIRPFNMVKTAVRINATGLGLDKLIINPITYWLATRKGMRIYCYPLKTRLGTRLYHRLYPQIDIMTSHPEKINRRTI